MISLESHIKSELVLIIILARPLTAWTADGPGYPNSSCASQPGSALRSTLPRPSFVRRAAPAEQSRGRALQGIVKTGHSAADNEIAQLGERPDIPPC